jgi:hypothetical protein
LFVADLFHPIDHLPAQRFLNGYVCIALVGVAPCQCFSSGENQTSQQRGILIQLVDSFQNAMG